MAKRIRGEFGYSLVEVMVSIIILTIAILPMVTMFDMGLQGATAGSKYDKARMLANLKLEQAKNLPFAAVENNFPQAGITTPYDDPNTWLQGEDEDVEFTGLEYRVVKQYIKQPEANPAGPSEFFECTLANDCAPPTDLIRVTIHVQWSNGGSTNTYKTLGLVAK